MARWIAILTLIAPLFACSHAPQRLRDDEPGSAERYEAMRRTGTDDPAAALARARQAMSLLPRSFTQATDRRIATDSASLTWQFLGPGNIGGRTRTLIIDPADPRTMYAGGVSGGIWKSDNEGSSWRSIGDDLSNLAVNSLVMDPANHLVLYAGTGEGYFREEVRGTALPLRGNGIFRTADGGETWTLLESTTNADFHFVNDLVVSAHDSSRLYAATRTGVWLSRDSGNSWTRVLSTTVKGGCLDLALRGDTASDYLFASCGTFEQATVYRTKNGESGETWQPVLSEPNQGRTSLAISRSNPSIVYALAATNQPGVRNQALLGVYRSDADGDAGSWQPTIASAPSPRIETHMLSNLYTATTQDCYGPQAPPNQQTTMGWYCNVIAVDPTNPERVWLGGVDVFRSDDGGRTFGPASYWWTTAETPSFLHADQHAIVFDPRYDGSTNTTMYFANDGGLYRTANPYAEVSTSFSAACTPASSLVHFENLNRDYGVTQFYHGAVFPDGRSFIGGTQDNGTLLGTIDAGPNGWRRIAGGDGGYVAVDPAQPEIIYAEAQFGFFLRSFDGGYLFHTSSATLADSGFLFVTPFALDPNNPLRLWIGGRRMWRTENRGGTWFNVSAPLPASVSAIAIAPGNSDLVLAGTATGDIARSISATTSNSNVAWQVTRPRAGFVSSIAFASATTVYATYAGFGGEHVWKSVDGGATWQPLASNLPDMPVHSIAIDPTRTNRLYLGTDLGVFVSMDSGASWAVENTGFAAAVTEAVVIGTGERGPAVYAFTHGRGVWRAELTPVATKHRSVRP